MRVLSVRACLLLKLQTSSTRPVAQLQTCCLLQKEKLNGCSFKLLGWTPCCPPHFCHTYLNSSWLKFNKMLETFHRVFGRYNMVALTYILFIARGCYCQYPYVFHFQPFHFVQFLPALQSLCFFPSDQIQLFAQSFQHP